MKRSRRNVLAIVLGLVLVCDVPDVGAGIIADRSTLNSLLGSGAVTEGFESFDVSLFGNVSALPFGKTAFDVSVQTLSSETIFLGQGPGLVVDGVAFRNLGGAPIQWNGVGWFGTVSQDLSAFSFPSEAFVVDFTAPASAFGFDLVAFSGSVSGTGDNTISVEIDVFGIDDTTHLGGPFVLIVSYPTPVFFGFSDIAGIGSVQLRGNTISSPPSIDNVTFGAVRAVPEPASLLFLWTGFAALASWSWKKRNRVGKGR